jgi:hypothetical protein
MIMFRQANFVGVTDCSGSPVDWTEWRASGGNLTVTATANSCEWAVAIGLEFRTNLATSWTDAFLGVAVRLISCVWVLSGPPYFSAPTKSTGATPIGDYARVFCGAVGGNSTQDSSSATVS